MTFAVLVDLEMSGQVAGQDAERQRFESRVPPEHWPTPETPDKYAAPVPLDARSHLIDWDCSGAAPYLLGVLPDAAGIPTWHMYKFDQTNGWEEQTGPQFRRTSACSAGSSRLSYADLLAAGRAAMSHIEHRGL
jgi:hypothetical protein